MPLLLRAWAPVLASPQEVLGDDLITRLRGDWRAGQAEAVREVLADPAQRAGEGGGPDGGDPGHEPARRVYEGAGFAPLPVVRYLRMS